MNISPEELNLMLASNPALLEKNPGLAKKLGLTKQDNKTGEKQKKDPKYLNKKVYVYEDGFASFDGKSNDHGRLVEKYDSLKEYRRYNELKLLERAGEISDLQRQVKFVIQPAFQYRNERINEIAYIADHVYSRKDGETVVEDVKGVDKNGKEVTATKDFKLKWKLLKAKYPQYLFTFAP